MVTRKFAAEKAKEFIDKNTETIYISDYLNLRNLCLSVIAVGVFAIEGIRSIVTNEDSGYYGFSAENISGVATFSLTLESPEETFSLEYLPDDKSIVVEFSNTESLNNLLIESSIQYMKSSEDTSNKKYSIAITLETSKNGDQKIIISFSENSNGVSLENLNEVFLNKYLLILLKAQTINYNTYISVSLRPVIEMKP
jgi:hypothetical protein